MCVRQTRFEGGMEIEVDNVEEQKVEAVVAIAIAAAGVRGTGSDEASAKKKNTVSKKAHIAS